LITGALVVGVMLGILAAELVRACQHWFAKPRVNIEDEDEHPFIRRFN